MKVEITTTLHYIEQHPQCCFHQLQQQTKISASCLGKSLRLLKNRHLITGDEQHRLRLTPDGQNYLHCQTKGID